MNRKKYCHYLLNIYLVINFLFIEIENTIDSYSSKSKSNTSISLPSPHHRNYHLHNRDRRSVRRGQNNYYQRSYDLNRLRHELQTANSEPRLKSFFHPVNEVYSYYLPKRYNKISANIENFSDSNQAFGTKTRFRSTSTGEERYSVTRRVSPAAGLLPYDPIGGVVGGGVGPGGGGGGGGGGVGAPPSRGQQPPYGVRRRTGFGQSGGQPYDPAGGPPYEPTGGQPYDPTGGGSGRQPGGGGAGGGGVSPYPRRTARPSFPIIPEPPFVRNSTYTGIPGYIRSDFPGYSNVPFTGFRCRSQPYYGYYADVNAGCQVFHVCQPDGREFSFLCPNSTLFHQKVQTCDWWYNVDCPSSPRYYYLNARIGVLPPIDATLFRFDPQPVG